MSQKKLFVLSMDAMVSEDIDYLFSLPESNFAKLFGRAAGVRKMQTVYPSITYPSHVSIMTGCNPGKTGVYQNYDMDTTGGHPAWKLYRSDIHVDTIFDAAKRQGLTTAAVYWPTTGNDPSIDYLINEFFFYENEDPVEAFRGFGANEATIKAVKENLHLFPDENHHNWGGYYIDFINGCTCSLIRDVKPDVFLVHNCLFDTLRHLNGAFNQAITDGLAKFDQQLGELVQAMKDAGTFEDTDFVLLSDHGQQNYCRKVHLNYLLRQGGFLDIDENNKVKDYRAFVQSNGFSAYIFLKDKSDRKTYEEVYAYLKKLSEEKMWGFREVYTEEECRQQFGLWGDFSFLVETDNYTYCASGWSKVEEDIDFTADHRPGHASHGYLPWKFAQPIFWCTGPSFREGVVLEKSLTINEAPTLAATFGGVLPEADGCVLTELLK